MAIKEHEIKYFLEDLGKFTSEYKRRASPTEILNSGVTNMFLDVDSTICRIEGVDKLARIKGVAREAENMTSNAMNGNGNFADIFAHRLDLIKPTRKDLDQLGKQYIESLVEDAKSTIQGCLFFDIDVRLISGGYLQALDYLRRELDLPHKALIANELNFNVDNEYAGFMRDIPLYRNHGKPLVILKQKSQGKNGGVWAGVGDGSTDLETLPVVDLFIGYGGVQRRSKIEEACLVYIYCESLSPIFVMATGVKNWEAVMRSSKNVLLQKGMKHILKGDVKLTGGYETLIEEIKYFLQERSWEKKLWNDI